MIGKMVLHLSVIVATAVSASLANADVFNMGGTRNPSTGAWTGSASLEMVPIGNPHNAPDTSNGSPDFGEVDYSYSIGKYDVTVAQYLVFLNAVAKSDPYGLYNGNMVDGEESYPFGIAQTGSSGSYSYSIIGSNPQVANMPMFCVSWYDAARFCNWLQNGQPVGAEGAGTTETGAYTLNGNGSDTRNPGAIYFLPSESEWYKAAFYDPSLNGGAGGYWSYATRSNVAPDNSLVLAESDSNDANYYGNGWTDPTNFLTPVGTFAETYSYYGTFDQNGDVWNWTETGFSVDRDMRGGQWDSGALTLVSGKHFQVNATATGDENGFRIASSLVVPEPNSISVLIACGILSLPFAVRSVWRRADKRAWA